MNKIKVQFPIIFMLMLMIGCGSNYEARERNVVKIGMNWDFVKDKLEYNGWKDQYTKFELVADPCNINKRSYIFAHPSESKIIFSTALENGYKASDNVSN